MARYTGPKTKIARKFGEAIFGEDKSFEKRNYPPGQHGNSRRRGKQSEYAIQLKENRDLNNFKFHIENSALSNRKLMQKGWDTIPSDILEDGYNWVNTITLVELKNKYCVKC